MESPIRTPPNAPHKPYSLRHIPMWRFVAESGLVRKKFLHYNVEDVEEIDCLETLEHLYKLYGLPSSQANNLTEDFYISLMATKIAAKIYRLKK